MVTNVYEAQNTSAKPYILQSDNASLVGWDTSSSIVLWILLDSKRLRVSASHMLVWIS